MKIYTFRPGRTVYDKALYFEAENFSEACTKIPKLIEIYHEKEKTAWKEAKALHEKVQTVWDERKAKKEIKEGERRPENWDWKEPSSIDDTYGEVNITVVAKKEEV